MLGVKEYVFRDLLGRHRAVREQSSTRLVRVKAVGCSHVFAASPSDLQSVGADAERMRFM